MDLWLIGGPSAKEYMCILLYVKLIGCNGFAYILCLIGGGDGVSLPWVYVHSTICETYWV